MRLTEILSVIGAITGPLGFVISLLVFFRDRERVIVNLAFDMQGFGGMPNIPEKYFLVSIYNVGRRPIYLSHVHLAVPMRLVKKVGASHLLLGSGLQGVTLSEGGAPHIVPTRQTNLAEQGTIWAYLRACVIDATGRQYYSDWPTTKPEWAGSHPLRFRVFTNKVRNRVRRFWPK